MEQMIVGIDVGTTKICTLVGEIGAANELHIIGVGISPSQGLKKGVVTSVKEATEAITLSIEKAERVSGFHIENAFVGVAGAHIASLNSRGVVAVGRGARPVLQEDIDRAMDAALAVAIHHDSDIIHAIPTGFTLDGQDGVRDPVGMRGLKLEVQAHIVTGAIASLENLVTCVKNAGVEVNELVLEPLASAEAVLTLSEREMGVVLVDIGGGTTDLAIFNRGSIAHTAVLATGGNHLTYDVAMGLRMPFTAAEEAKLHYGHCLVSAISESETFEVQAFGQEGQHRFSRRDLADILEARCNEIFEMIKAEVQSAGYDRLLPAGAVLCGGTSELEGFQTMARDILDWPVRIGSPHNLSGLVDVISTPAYATSVGLLLWGIRNNKVSVGRQARRKAPGEGDSIGRFMHWLRAFLPS
ncbi:MAG: cell division protein FtsA [Chloroflexi bacterium]|nr:cell division protein FtsA [Chloroflexota bacterium]